MLKDGPFIFGKVGLPEPIWVLTESVYRVTLLSTDSVDIYCEVSFLEKFLSLPIEKQNTIIDAAINSFATNGYKKTSVSDIAAAAGISKAMVFHYFGTKKTLYFHLIDLLSRVVMNEINDKFDSQVTDFFDRVKLVTNIKISVMEKHPAILAFFNSIFFEQDEEVMTEVKDVLAKGEDFRNKIALDGMDASKFKDGIEPKLVMKMLVRFVEGFLSELSNRAELDLVAVCKEFDACIHLLKNNLYKEQYL